jgi:hypothetical protein
MSYWKRVLRRVALEAAKDAKLDTVASATIHLVVQGVVSLIIWVALSHVLPPGTLWARILGTAVPLLTFPIAMGVRFFTVPADVSREDKSEIEHLTSALETRERRKVVKASLAEPSRRVKDFSREIRTEVSAQGKQRRSGSQLHEISLPLRLGRARRRCCLATPDILSTALTDQLEFGSRGDFDA